MSDQVKPVKAMFLDSLGRWVDGFKISSNRLGTMRGLKRYLIW